MTTEQQLPKGWKKTTFGEIAQVVSGGTPNTKLGTNFAEKGKGISWITPADLSKHTDKFISNGARDLSNDGYKSCSAKILPAGTVLLSSRAPIGYVAIAQNELSTNQGFKNFILSDDILSEYAYYYLKSIKSTIESLGSGTTFLELSASNARRIPIIYPTSQETQQAIVNKIESLFDEIDEGIGRLKTAAQQIQQYRQSLLKNAFNGELTKEWRSKHADALPSENELLAQIQTTREQHHAQQLASWQTAVSQWEQNGKEGKKPSKPKAPTQAVKFEENSENRNKNSYIRIPIGFFIETPKYGTSKKCEYEKYENSTGVIRIPNITENGLINLEDMKYAEFSTEDKTDYALKKGDLLLIRSNGSVNIVGSVGLVGLEETNYIYAGYLIRLRPIQGIVNSRFLKFAFQSLDVRTQIEFKAKSTSGVNNINAQEVQDLQVNVFSLPEQTQIVAILESKLTACDQLAAELAKQLKQAELLKQAVLKAAFSGSLLDK